MASVRMQLHVLWVDADAQRLAVSEREVTQLGHVVRSVSTVEDLERAVRDDGYDVIVAHVSLVGGDSALPKLQSAQRGVELILLSDTADDAEVERALRAGAFEVLKRPVAPQRLQLTLERAMEHQRVVSSALLYELGTGILEAETAAELSLSVLNTARAVLHVDSASLWRVGPDGRHTLHEATSELDTEQLIRERAAAEQGPDADDARTLVFPLRAAGLLLGILVMRRSAQSLPFTHRDRGLAAAFAGHVRIAVENLRFRSARSAAERLATIGELVAGVAHEINNPAAFVISNLKFLSDALGRNAEESEEARELYECAHEAHEGALRIAELVKDLRILSRADVERRQLVMLEDVINASVRLARATLGGVKLRREIQKDVQLSANPGRLSQVFVNLLANAAQASEGLPPSRRLLWVRAREESNLVRIEFQDLGSGIPPELLPRLFEPYFTTKPPGKGTGLGLSIAREIIEQHGGEILVRSRPGEGTTFEISLPRVFAEGRAREALPEGLKQKLDARPEIVVLLNARGQILYANSAWDAFRRENGGSASWASEALEGRYWLEAVRGEVRAPIERALNRVLESAAQEVPLTIAFETECNSPGLWRRARTELSSCAEPDAPHTVRVRHLILEEAPFTEHYPSPSPEVLSWVRSFGVTTQCGCCRRALVATQPPQWAFVPLEVMAPHVGVRLILCPFCEEGCLQPVEVPLH